MVSKCEFNNGAHRTDCVHTKRRITTANCLEMLLRNGTNSGCSKKNGKELYRKGLYWTNRDRTKKRVKVGKGKVAPNPFKRMRIDGCLFCLKSREKKNAEEGEAEAAQSIGTLYDRRPPFSQPTQLWCGGVTAARAPKGESRPSHLLTDQYEMFTLKCSAFSRAIHRRTHICARECVKYHFTPYLLFGIGILLGCFDVCVCVLK